MIVKSTWAVGEGPDEKTYDVTTVIDVDRVTSELLYRARHNKSGQSTALCKSVKVIAKLRETAKDSEP